MSTEEIKSDDYWELPCSTCTGDGCESISKDPCDDLKEWCKERDCDIERF